VSRSRNLRRVIKQAAKDLGISDDIFAEGAELGERALRAITDAFGADDAPTPQQVQRIVRREANASPPSLAAKPPARKPAAKPSLAVRSPARVAPAAPMMNIGLGRANRLNPTPEPISAEQAVSAVKSFGIPIQRQSLVTGGDEDAVVFSLGREPTPEEAFDLSKMLDQEAVAVYAGGEGRTYGPYADDWQFGPEYFRVHGGQPLLEAPRTERLAARAMDPRIEGRKGELPKVERLTVNIEPRRRAPVEELSVFDLEGRPFITSMSDLSAAGDDVTAINDVALREPFVRRGGQDYMFDNPGSVWAADLGNARAHMALADRLRVETGQDPLFMPWAMSPTSIDFAHMPREAMLRYNDAALSARGRQQLARDIREIVPEFKSTDDPASVEAFTRATGSARAALNRLMDQYRTKGGMGIGEARLASTDLEQLGRPLTSLRNVGTIDPRSDLAVSSHPSYRSAIPGEGVGRLREPVGALDLLPDIVRASGIEGPFDFPVGVVAGRPSPLRSLQMAPKGGIITEDILRAIEDRLAVRKASKD